MRALGRIEGKLDGMSEQADRLRADHDSLNNRVALLEKSETTARAWAAGAGFTGGGVFALLKAKLGL